MVNISNETLADVKAAENRNQEYAERIAAKFLKERLVDFVARYRVLDNLTFVEELQRHFNVRDK